VRSRRTPLVFALVALSSCSVLNNLDEYSGGTRDASVSDSTTEVGSDSSIDGPDDTTPDSTVDTTDGAKDDTPDTADAGPDVAIDSGTDTADATVPDTTDAADVADTTDTAVVEAGPCGSVCSFGISEVMVRAVSGAGDKREWVEFTNYTSGTLDISAVTVKIFTTSEKASFTFPAGTTLTAGEAIVVADDDTSFKADVTTGYGLGKVFSFAKPAGDILVNSSFNVRLYAPGVSAPYEDALVSRSTWPAGRAYAYPPPTSVCPASGRLTGTGALTAPWKDVPVDVAQKYGEYPVGTPLYGTPTKANTGVACP
jgi:hypothetical protein